MNNKFFDYAFPISGSASGGVFGAITFGSIAETAVTAIVFAVIGGVVGFFVKKCLDKIYKKK